MLVQCPRCHTTYKVADSLITTPSPTYRCSGCKHIFVLSSMPDGGRVRETTFSLPSTPLTDEEENQELSFSFPASERSEAGEEKNEDHPSSGTVEEQLPRPAANPFTISEEGGSLQLDTSTDKGKEFEEDWQKSFPQPGEREPIPALDPDRDRPVSTRLCLSLFGALLLIYSLITLMHQAQPKTVETFIKTIPWLGFSVFKNNHLPQGIALQSLRPRFQTISGNRKVFVISGMAVNHNPVSVRGVRVEGHIYNREGKEIGRQAIWVGNAISPKIVKNLTAQEISILQKLSPQMRFEIDPEGSAGFVIVFLKPGREVKEFSFRVLSVEESV